MQHEAHSLRWWLFHHIWFQYDYHIWVFFWVQQCVSDALDLLSHGDFYLKVFVVLSLFVCLFVCSFFISIHIYLSWYKLVFLITSVIADTAKLLIMILRCSLYYKPPGSHCVITSADISIHFYQKLIFTQLF